MPIYEYQCGECGAHLEKLQKISDPVLKDCPECNKASLKKMISATSFRLKGTGWYETDFKTGNRKHGAEDKASQPEKVNENPATEKKGSAEGSESSSKASSGKTGETAKSSTNNSANKETSS